MEEEEKRKKLLAGKGKLAAFQKKRGGKKKKKRLNIDSDACETLDSAELGGYASGSSDTHSVYSYESDNQDQTSEDEIMTEEQGTGRHVQKARMELRNAAEQIAMLEESVLGKQAAMDRLTQDIQEMKRENESLKKEFTSLKEKEVQNLEGITKRDNLIQQLLASLQACRETVDGGGFQKDYTAETQQLAEQVQLLQLQLQQSGATLTGQMQQHNMSAQALQDAKLEILNLQQKIQSKDSLVEQLTRKLSELTEEYIKLQNLHEIIKEKECHSSEVVQQLMQNVELLKNTSRNGGQLKSSTVDIVCHEQQMTNLRNELEEMYGHQINEMKQYLLQRQQEETDTCKQEMQEVEEERDNLLLKVNSYEAEIKGLLADLAEVKTKLLSSNSLNENLEAQLSSFRECIANLENKLQSGLEDNAFLKSQIQSIEEEKNGYLVRMNQLEDKVRGFVNQLNDSKHEQTEYEQLKNENLLGQSANFEYNRCNEACDSVDFDPQKFHLEAVNACDENLKQTLTFQSSIEQLQPEQSKIMDWDILQHNLTECQSFESLLDLLKSCSVTYGIADLLLKFDLINRSSFQAGLPSTMQLESFSSAVDIQDQAMTGSQKKRVSKWRADISENAEREVDSYQHPLNTASCEKGVLVAEGKNLKEILNDLIAKCRDVQTEMELSFREGSLLAMSSAKESLPTDGANDELDETIRLLEWYFEYLGTTSAAVTSEISSLYGIVDDLQKDKEGLQMKVKDYHLQLESIRSQVELMDDEKQELQNFHSKIKDLQERILVLQEEKEVNEGTISHLLSDLGNTKLELKTDFSTEAQLCEVDLVPDLKESLQGDRTLLQSVDFGCQISKENHLQLNMLDGHTSSLRKNTAPLSERQRRRDFLEEEREKLKEDCKMFAELLEEKEIVLEALTVKSEGYGAEISNLSSVLRETMEELAKSQESVKTLELENISIKEEKDNLNTVLLKKESELQIIQEMLKRNREEMLMHNEDENNLQEKLHTFESENRVLKESCDSAMMESEQLKTELETSEEKIQELKTEIISLRDTSTKEKKTLENEMKKLEEENLNLAEEMTYLEHQNSDYVAKTNEQQVVIEQLVDKTNELETELDELVKRTKEQEAEIRELEEKTKELEAEVRELMREQEAEMKELEEKMKGQQEAEMRELEEKMKGQQEAEMRELEEKMKGQQEAEMRELEEKMKGQQEAEMRELEEKMKGQQEAEMRELEEKMKGQQEAEMRELEEKMKGQQEAEMRELEEKMKGQQEAEMRELEEKMKGQQEAEMRELAEKMKGQQEAEMRELEEKMKGQQEAEMRELEEKMKGQQEAEMRELEEKMKGQQEAEMRELEEKMKGQQEAEMRELAEKMKGQQEAEMRELAEKMKQKTDIKQLIGKNKELESKMKESVGDLTVMKKEQEAEIRELQHKNDNMVQFVHFVEKERNEVTNEKEVANKKNEDLLAKVNELENKVSFLNAELSSLNLCLDNLKKERDGLSEENKKYTEELERLLSGHQESKQLKQNIQELLVLVKDSEAEIRMLKMENSTVVKLNKYKEVQRKLDVLSCHLDEHWLKIDELNQEKSVVVRHHESENESFKKRILELSESLADKEIEITRLREENGLGDMKIVCQERKSKDLQIDSEQKLRLEYSAVLAENKGLKDLIAELNMKIQEIIKEKNDIGEMLTRNCDEQSKEIKYIEELNRNYFQMERMQEDRDSRDLIISDDSHSKIDASYSLNITDNELANTRELLKAENEELEVKKEVNFVCSEWSGKTEEMGSDYGSAERDINIENLLSCPYTKSSEIIHSQDDFSEKLSQLQKKHEEEMQSEIEFLKEHYERELKYVRLEVLEGLKDEKKQYREELEQKYLLKVESFTAEKENEFIQSLQKVRAEMEQTQRGELERLKLSVIQEQQLASLAHEEESSHLGDVVQKLQIENQELAEVRDALLQQIEQFRYEQEKLQKELSYAVKGSETLPDKMNSHTSLPANDLNEFPRTMQNSEDCGNSDMWGSMELTRSQLSVTSSVDIKQFGEDLCFDVDLVDENVSQSTPASSVEHHAAPAESLIMAKLKHRCNNYQSLISLLEKENKSLKKHSEVELELFVQEKYQLQRQCENLTNSVDSVTLMKNQLEQELSVLREELQNSTAQSKPDSEHSLRELVASLKTKLADAEDFVVLMQNQISQKEIEKEELQCKIKDLFNKVVDQQHYIDTMEEELPALWSGMAGRERNKQHCVSEKSVVDEFQHGEGELNAVAVMQEYFSSCQQSGKFTGDEFLRSSLDQEEIVRKAQDGTRNKDELGDGLTKPILQGSLDLMQLNRSDVGHGRSVQKDLEVADTVMSEQDAKQTDINLKHADWSRSSGHEPVDKMKIKLEESLELKHFEIADEVAQLRQDLIETKEFYATENALLKEALEQKLSDETTNTEYAEESGEIDEASLSFKISSLRKKLAVIGETNKMLKEENNSLMKKLRDQECLVLYMRQLSEKVVVGNEHLHLLYGSQLAILQKHRDELLQSLEEKMSGRNQLAEVVGDKAVLEENLRREKELLAEKMHEKTVLETELTEKRVKLEEVNQQQKLLEEELRQKEKMEKELMRQKRFLEDEFAEIESKLHEKEQTLEEEKTQLLKELKEKDCLVKKLKSDYQDQQNSYWSQGETLKEHFSQELSNVRVSLEREKIDHLEEMRKQMEQQHTIAIQFLREELKADFGIQECRLRKEHASDISSLHRRHTEQLQQFRDQYEKQMEELTIRLQSKEQVPEGNGFVMQHQNTSSYHEMLARLQKILNDEQRQQVQQLLDLMKDAQSQKLNEMRQQCEGEMELREKAIRLSLEQVYKSQSELAEARLVEEKLEELAELREMLTKKHKKEISRRESDWSGHLEQLREQYDRQITAGMKPAPKGAVGTEEGGELIKNLTRKLNEEHKKIIEAFVGMGKPCVGLKWLAVSSVTDQWMSSFFDIIVTDADVHHLREAISRHDKDDSISEMMPLLPATDLEDSIETFSEASTDDHSRADTTGTEDEKQIRTGIRELLEEQKEEVLHLRSRILSEYEQLLKARADSVLSQSGDVLKLQEDISRLQQQYEIQVAGMSVDRQDGSESLRRKLEEDHAQVLQNLHEYYKEKMREAVSSFSSEIEDLKLKHELDLSLRSADTSSLCDELNDAKDDLFVKETELGSEPLTSTREKLRSEHKSTDVHKNIFIQELTPLPSSSSPAKSLLAVDQVDRFDFSSQEEVKLEHQSQMEDKCVKDIMEAESRHSKEMEALQEEVLLLQNELSVIQQTKVELQEQRDEMEHRYKEAILELRQQLEHEHKVEVESMQAEFKLQLDVELRKQAAGLAEKEEGSIDRKECFFSEAGTTISSSELGLIQETVRKYEERILEMTKDFEVRTANLRVELQELHMHEKEEMSKKFTKHIENLQEQLADTEEKYEHIMEGLRSGKVPEVAQLMREKYDTELELAKALMQQEFDESMDTEQMRLQEHNQAMLDDLVAAQEKEMEEVQARFQAKLSDLKRCLCTNCEEQVKMLETLEQQKVDYSRESKMKMLMEKNEQLQQALDTKDWEMTSQLHQLESSHREELTKLKEEYKQKLDKQYKELNNQHEDQIEAAALDTDVQKMKLDDVHRAEILKLHSSLSEKHEKELSNLESQYTAKIEELEHRHKLELEKYQQSKILLYQADVQMIDVGTQAFSEQQGVSVEALELSEYDISKMQLSGLSMLPLDEDTSGGQAASTSLLQTHTFTSVVRSASDEKFKEPQLGRNSSSQERTEMLDESIPVPPDIISVNAERDSLQQSNEQLLNVLSGLVKMYLKMEDAINNKLSEATSSKSQLPRFQEPEKLEGQAILELDRFGRSKSVPAIREDATQNLSRDRARSMETSGIAEENKELHETSTASNVTDEGLVLSRQFMDCLFTGPNLDAASQELIDDASHRLHQSITRLLDVIEDITHRHLDTQSAHDELVQTLAIKNEEAEQLAAKNHDFDEQLNSELAAKEYLALELHKAQGLIEGYLQERVLLDRKVKELEEQQEVLIQELETNYNKVRDFESSRAELESLREELERQQAVLRDNAGQEVQGKETRDMERAEQQGLLHEITYLNDDKRTLQQQLEETQKKYEAHIRDVMNSGEDMEHGYEVLLEEKTRQLEDMKLQLEAAERQVKANKQFINEQAMEREQEQEEYQREICNWKSLLEEKDLRQKAHLRLQHEVEDLTEQLESRISTQGKMVQKREQLERDLQDQELTAQEMKAWILQLEQELDAKTKLVDQLKEKIVSLEAELQQQQQIIDELSQELRSSSPVELKQVITELESQLMVKEQIIQKNTASLDEELRKSQQKEEELKCENTALQKQVCDQLVTVSTLKTSLDEFRHQIGDAKRKEALKQDMEKKEMDLEMLEKEMEKMSLELQRTEEELRRKEQYMQELMDSSADQLNKILDIQAENRQLQKEVESLQQRISSSSSFPSITQDLLEEKNQEIKHLKNQLLKQEEFNSAEKADKLREKLQQVMADLQKKDSDIIRLQQMIDSLQQQDEDAFLGDVSLTFGQEVPLSSHSSPEKTSLQQELSVVLTDKDQEIVSLQSQLDERGYQQEEVQEQLSQAHERISVLSDVLQERETNLEQMGLQVESLQCEVDSLTDYQAKLQEDFDTVQNMLEEKDREIESLTKELTDVRSPVLGANTDLLMKYEMGITQLKRSVKEKENVIEEKEEELYTLHEKLEQNEADVDLKKMEQLLQEKEEEVSILTEKSQQWHQKCDQAEFRLREREEQLHQLQDEMTAKDAEHETLQQQFLQLEHQLGVQEVKLHTMQQKCAEMAQDLEKSEFDLRDANVTRDDLDRTVKQKDRELDFLKQQLSELVQQNHNLSEELEKVHQQYLLALESQGKEDEAFMHTAEDEGRSVVLRSEVEELHKEVMERDNELAKMQEELEAHVQAVKALEQARLDDDVKIKKLESRGRQSVQDFLGQIQDLTDRLEAAQVRHNEQCQELSLVRKELEERNSVDGKNASLQVQISKLQEVKTHQIYQIGEQLKELQDNPPELKDEENGDVSTIVKEIEHYKKEIENKERKLQEYKEEILAKDRKIQRVQDDLNMSKQSFEEREQAINFLWKEREEQTCEAEGRVVVLREVVEQLQKDLMTKDEESKKLQMCFNESKRAVGQLEMEIRNLRDELQTKDKLNQVSGSTTKPDGSEQLSALQTELCTARALVADLHSTRAEQEMKLQEQASRIESLQADLERREDVRSRNITTRIDAVFSESSDTDASSSFPVNQPKIKQWRDKEQESSDLPSTGESSGTEALSSDSNIPARLKVLLSRLHQEGVRMLSLSELQFIRQNTSLQCTDKQTETVSLQSAWDMEKQALLETIQSLKDLLACSQTIRNQDMQQPNRTWTDWRADLLQAICYVFARERETTLAELNSEKLANSTSNTNAIMKLEKRVQEQEMFHKRTLDEVLHADRQSLVAELRDMHARLTIIQLQNDEERQQLSEQLTSLENQSAKRELQLQRRIKLLEYRLTQERILQSDLESSLELERNRTADLAAQVNRERNVNLDMHSELTTLQVETSKLKDSLEQEHSRCMSIMAALEDEKLKTTALIEHLEVEKKRGQQLELKLDNRMCQIARERDTEIGHLRLEVENLKTNEDELARLAEQEKIKSSNIHEELESERIHQQAVEAEYKSRVSQLQTEMAEAAFRTEELQSMLSKEKHLCAQLQQSLEKMCQVRHDVSERDRSAIHDLQALLASERSRASDLQERLDSERQRMWTESKSRKAEQQQAVEELEKERTTTKLLQIKATSLEVQGTELRLQLKLEKDRAVHLQAERQQLTSEMRMVRSLESDRKRQQDAEKLMDRKKLKEMEQERENDKIKMHENDLEIQRLQQKVSILERDLREAQFENSNWVHERELENLKNTQQRVDANCCRSKHKTTDKAKLESYKHHLEVIHLHLCSVAAQFHEKLSDLIRYVCGKPAVRDAEEILQSFQSCLMKLLTELKQLQVSFTSESQDWHIPSGSLSYTGSHRVLQHNAELTGFVLKMSKEKMALRIQISQLEEQLEKCREMQSAHKTWTCTEEETDSQETTFLVQKRNWARERLSFEVAITEAEKQIEQLQKDLRIERERCLALSSNAADQEMIHRLYKKYLRAENFRRALVYQKKYLLQLVGGFRDTEETVLVLMAKMGAYPSRDGAHAPRYHRRPLTIFRSGVRVLIAIARMKHFARKLQRAARVGYPVVSGMLNTDHGYVASSTSFCLPASSNHISTSDNSPDDPQSLDSSDASALELITPSYCHKKHTPPTKDRLMSHQATSLARLNASSSSTILSSTDNQYDMDDDYASRLQRVKQKLGGLTAESNHIQL